MAVHNDSMTVSPRATLAAHKVVDTGRPAIAHRPNLQQAQVVPERTAVPAVGQLSQAAGDVKVRGDRPPGGHDVVADPAHRDT